MRYIICIHLLTFILGEVLWALSEQHQQDGDATTACCAGISVYAFAKERQMCFGFKKKFPWEV